MDIEKYPFLPHLFLCYLIKNPEIFVCYYKIVTFAKMISMGTKDKLIARFKKQPSDFTFDEMEKLLAILNQTKVKLLDHGLFIKMEIKGLSCCINPIREMFLNRMR